MQLLPLLDMAEMTSMKTLRTANKCIFHLWCPLSAIFHEFISIIRFFYLSIRIVTGYPSQAYHTIWQLKGTYQAYITLDEWITIEIILIQGWILCTDSMMSNVRIDRRIHIFIELLDHSILHLSEELILTTFMASKREGFLIENFLLPEIPLTTFFMENSLSRNTVYHP